MKRALFLYLFLCLTTFLSSQLNPIPPVNRKAGVVPPINAPQLPSTRIRAATRRTNPLQTAALSFAPSVVYFSGGEFTTSVAVADVNGDGKPDLLLTNYGSGVAVLLGNGDGTFQAVVSYGAGGSFTHSVAVADVDGDGKPDLVVADECVNSSNCYNGIVGVLLGNGDGTFQTALTYGSGGDAGANLVTVADVNGDGKPDIEVAIGCFGCNNGSVGVLINTSVSSATTALTSSSNPSSIGQAVTFAATVTSQGFKIMPTGTVSFFDGTKTFGTVELNGNVANITTSGLSIGTHSITAVYSGDSNFIGSSSNTLKQLVQGAYGVVSPTTENFGPILIGQTSTQRLISLKNTGGSELTISSISISGDFALPVNRCAEGVKPSTHCNVEITFTPHTPGTQTGTLTFTDNAPNSPQTVSLTGTGSNVASTTTTLSSSPNPSTFGEAVKFTAVVTPVPPDGETVSFMKGTTVLGMGTLSDGSGSFTTSTLKVGTTPVTADYGGDADFKGSKSKPVKQVVKK